MLQATHFSVVHHHNLRLLLTSYKQPGHKTAWKQHPLGAHIRHAAKTPAPNNRHRCPYLYSTKGEAHNSASPPGHTMSRTTASHTKHTDFSLKEPDVLYLTLCMQQRLCQRRSAALEGGVQLVEGQHEALLCMEEAVGVQCADTLGQHWLAAAG